MSKHMRKDEHEYYHKLIWHLGRNSERKFEKGCVEHRDKGMLWEMSDEDLQKNFEEEMTDMMIYFAEKIRREYERKD